MIMIIYCYKQNGFQQAASWRGGKLGTGPLLGMGAPLRNRQAIQGSHWLGRSDYPEAQPPPPRPAPGHQPSFDSFLRDYM